MDNKKGISLISLVITIIVIIILAAIVIFNGFGTADSAQFAKFAQEYSSYGEEIQQRYLNAKVQSSLRGESKTDSEIYAEMADAEELQIADVLDGKVLSEDLDGTKCYKLLDNRSFYEGDSGTYITDKGEIFTLPGYRYNQNGEERRYVSASKYYAGNSIVTPGENEMATTLDQNDSSAEMWALLGAIAEKISNTGSINSDTEEATVTLNVNGTNKEYTIRIGDTYKVYSSVAGFEGEKIVRVLGFNHDTLASNPDKTAGISFEFVDFLMNARMGSGYTSNGWVDKEIYATLNSNENGAWKSLSNSEEIKEVTKTYITYYDPAQTSTSNDRLWLLAESEIWSEHSYGAKASEGTRYKYYKDRGVSSGWDSNNALIKPNDGTGNKWWWLRTPSYYESDRFCSVTSGGRCQDYGMYFADNIAPGFCI